MQQRLIDSKGSGMTFNVLTNTPPPGRDHVDISDT
jgi:hypothetical protein